MKLVIVESPTKAKTISKFLGKNFSVKSSYGHVRDLPPKEMGIEIKNDFLPQYEIPSKAAGRVSELKKLAQKSEKIILATDEDREGEAISWHLVEALDLEKIKKDYQRIVFHEITREAIKKALESPRKIDLDLVDAQQARRILDRLVGYELSPFLWKKIRRGLSAGRVQSVALRLIVEKQREIDNFKPEEFWYIFADLFVKNKRESFLQAVLSKKNGKALGKMGIKTKKEAEKTVAFLEKASFEVLKVEDKEIFKTPPPPYTTSSLQQDANIKLGMSAKSAMMNAQKLYEGIELGGEGRVGLITYMRTDSLNLSMESLIAAKKTIEKNFGKNYALESPRFFKNKSKGAQEAHEAIRPTFPEKNPQDLKKYLDQSQYRLYKLIWQRMLASQMSPAKIKNVSVEISASQKNSADNYILKSIGNSIIFDGYLKIFGEKKGPLENLIPEMKKGDLLELLKVNFQQKFTQPPARYSEATLIKALEENGIGRPSTYAPTISTIIERSYVEKDENKKLYPLEIGFVVSDLLAEHFPEIVDYGFTAKMEEDLDKIAEGKKEWQPVIKSFYIPFHKNLLEKNKNVSKEKYQEKVDRNCPECGGNLVIKFGRFGKFIACSNYPNCRYTEKTENERNVHEEIEKNNGTETCELCGAPMTIKRGKFGLFLGCSGYPNCKNIKKIENKVGLKCPRCLKGDIVEKKSKRGRIFYGCNAYPKCNFALWNRPTGEKCPKCQNPLVFSGKNKIKCSEKICNYEKEFLKSVE